jgi:hypothetical protein
MSSFDQTSDVDQADPLDSLTGQDPDEPQQTSYSPPERPPLEMRDPPTAAEERASGTIDDAVAREVPDVGEEDIFAADQDPRAGRLVAPDEGAHPDEEKDEVATDAGPAGYASSAEEAAVHIREEPED